MLPARRWKYFETKILRWFARIIDKVRHGQRIAEHSCR
jgi:hypothetical protein